MAMMGLNADRLIALGALFGLAHGVFYPAFNALAMEGVQPQNRGKMTGLFFGFFNVGFSGGTFLLGLLAEAAGYPAAFFAAGLGTFAALAILVWGRVPRSAFRSRCPSVRRSPSAIRRWHHPPRPHAPGSECSWSRTIG